MFYTCGPDEAIIVSGWCYKIPRLLVGGGRAFVLPCCQISQRINLNIMSLTINSDKIYTKQGVPISVTGVAQVKIESGSGLPAGPERDEKRAMLHIACQQFLGMGAKAIEKVVMDTLEGHQRAIMGTMTVVEIYKDRKKFSQAVRVVAEDDLKKMGMTIISYTLKDISDDQGYLAALGVPRTAEVQRDAKIGQAEARMESGIKSAQAEQTEFSAKYKNEIDIAQSDRDYKLSKAGYDIEVLTKKAEADLAQDLQVAKTRQKIRNEELKISVIDKTKQIQVQEQEIVRKERELEAQIKKPATAAKYKMVTIAEGEKHKTILKAKAEAQAITAKGNAEAYAIAAKAQAEAAAMEKKADAFRDYKEAAIVDMILATLPDIAHEISKPLTKAKKITMVSGQEGDLGAERVTGEVLNIMMSVPRVVQNLTGTDVFKGLETEV